MIIYGKQVCLYLLENHKYLIEEIFLNKIIDKNIFHKFSLLNKPIIKLDSKKMQALAKGGNHQGYILKVRDIGVCNFKNIQVCSKIVVLVGISDVGNIGSIFRSSLAFGIDAIISTNNINKSGVARASSGSFFDMPYLVYNNVLSLVNDLKTSGFTLFGSNMKGNDIRYVSDIPNKWALFLGSEGEGLPNRLLKKLDDVFCVKMKDFDSLNVSVAAGIMIHSMLKI